jgi:hypothetical protein
VPDDGHYRPKHVAIIDGIIKNWSCLMVIYIYIYANVNAVFGLLKKPNDKEVNMVGHEQM